MQAVSSFDVGSDKIEAFYHGFIIGLLGLCKAHHNAYLHSNKESGLGRPDLVIEPQDPKHFKYKIGVILEFKRTLESKRLKEEAIEGLVQIKSKHYGTELQSRGIHDIFIIGIAFCGKELECVYEKLPQPKVTAALTQIGLMPPPRAKKDKRRDVEEAEQPPGKRGCPGIDKGAEVLPPASLPA